MKLLQRIPLIVILAFFLLSGCSDTKDNLSPEEKIWQAYSDNNRLDKYNELKDSYGDNYWILKNNEKEDSWRVTNFMISFVSYIFPDTAAILTLSGMMWLVMILTGISLTGGTILAILAKVGKVMPLAFFPAAIAGVFTIGMVLVIIQRLLAYLYGLLF